MTVTESQVREILQANLDKENLAKLTAVSCKAVHRFVAEAIEHCQPASVFIRADTAKDEAFIRQLALDDGSESKLKREGHTIHFDGYNDLARDKGNTRYLLSPGQDLGKRINSMQRSEGLPEVMGFLKGAMAGKKMLVCFHCLGPTSSVFSIPVVQITDSSYVGHSLSLLYRPGYEQFKKVKDGDEFFRVLHSQGELTRGENGAPVSKNPVNRRMYIDLDENIVYSVNTQYAGNTVGLKKLSLRLAICKAAREGWLAEHMFLTAVPGPKDRWTYFSGAFPSACGKTSTAMIPGQKIVGDDLAYLRKIDGKVRAANVEAGIFGIIEDVKRKDDPVIFETLTQPNEIIFSNVLIKDGAPYWLGMGEELPKEGVNHWGNWREGMTDPEGAKITISHKNARYTLRMDDLANADPIYNDPRGVELSAIVYGGRDSDTHVPVTEAFDWNHGVLTMGACLESETTAATIGATGQRVFNIMSNLDFLSMTLGQYLNQYLDFAQGMSKLPTIFGVNYFLKSKDGKYLNGMLDKKVWVLWAERRTHGEVKAIEGPTGRYPHYADLQRLFKEALGADYTKEQYVQQFTIRVPELLAKNERIAALYRKDVPDTPEVFYKVMAEQKVRLEKLRAAKGDYVSPFDL